MPYGYAIYRAESPLSPGLQREADSQLGRFYAALPRIRRGRARSVRALRRPAGSGAGSRRVCVPAERGSQCLAALVVPVLAAPKAAERTQISRA
jgi:hypothetical protein